METVMPSVTILCSNRNVVMAIIVVLIIGAIIGAIARLVVPGKQSISMGVTIILGIVGSLIGYFIAGLFGVACTSGGDFIRWIISIIVAALLVVGYTRMSGRNTTV
jgi:uncharacterized membrane protein YeaQ/YmgE (transglycosylase-associated protein family)